MPKNVRVVKSAVNLSDLRAVNMAMCLCVPHASICLVGT